LSISSILNRSRHRKLEAAQMPRLQCCRPQFRLRAFEFPAFRFGSRPRISRDLAGRIDFVRPRGHES
jgi:hypothetical protein